MRQYTTLVALFWLQLIRRKSLWVVAAVVGGVILINAAVRSEMVGMLEEGLRYDIATRRAAASLAAFAEQIRVGAVLLALVAGALVAPPARRDGTTQFVLALSVSRRRLALCQYTALALFITLGTVVVHVGFMLTSYHLGTMRWSEALLAWPLLLVPLLLTAAVSFSLSLTRPALVVYAILLGIPYVLIPVLQALVGEMDAETPEVVRLLAARGLDNAALLFPWFAQLVVWPGIVPPVPERPPVPAWGLEALRVLAATGFWLVLGYWAYRRHGFGSRTPTR